MILEQAAETVSRIMAAWSEAFAKRDNPRIAALYSKHALFYGSTPILYEGVEGVRAYFEALPAMTSARAEFTELKIAPVGDGIINAAGLALFTINGEPSPRAYRISWVLVREDGHWKIIAHHASPKVS